MLGAFASQAQSVLDQNVSVTYKAESLKQILESLREDFHLDLTYSDDRIPVDKVLTIEVVNYPLRELLSQIAIKAKIDFQEVAGRVVFVPRPKAPSGPPNRITISGYIEDAATGEKLIGANVADVSTGQGISTNPYGFYSLTLDGPEVEIAVSFVGFQRQIFALDLQKDTVLDVEMVNALELEEFEVKASKTEDPSEATAMSTIEFNPADMADVPSLAGERDVLRNMQQYPGVSFGNEGSVSLYVRGGGPDQNLLLLDGVPIYNTYHLFGLVSIFNSSAVNNVRLIKGGYPARYAGRLSSVLDARIKEGNNKKLKGEVAAGLLTTQFTVEGPIKKNTTSFLLAFRRTYADLLATPLMREINRRNGVDGKWSFNFYDLNAKVNHKFSDKNRIYLSVYNSQDRGVNDRRENFFEDSTSTSYTLENNYNIKWSNLTSSVRWNHLFNNRLFANTTLFYSDYRFNINEDLNYYEEFNGATTFEFRVKTQYRSDIRDIGGRIEFNYFPSPRHNVRFGGGVVRHRFQPGVNAVVGSQNANFNFDNRAIFPYEYNAYVEDEFKIAPDLSVNVGAHGAAFQLEDTTYRSFQPRILLRYSISKSLAFKASYAEMTQYLHLLNNANIGLPVDLWVPPTKRVSPQESQQTAVGIVKHFKKGYEFSTEGYVRQMQNLIEYENGASFLNPNENWEDKIVVGTGRAFGVEFLFRKTTGRTTGWIGYTLSRSDRLFPDLNEGVRFPFKYDRTHDISATAIHKLNEKVTFSATWVFGTGSATTLPIGTFSAASTNIRNQFLPDLLEFGSRNGHRLRDYHRLDLAVTFKKKISWGERILNLSLYNTYSRRNPFFVYLSVDEDGKRRFKEVSYFPIIPSFRYAIRF